MVFNGWASNNLIIVDTAYTGIHHSKYWMPIYYDTTEGGQNKQSHLLFSNSNLPLQVMFKILSLIKLIITTSATK